MSKIATVKKLSRDKTQEMRKRVKTATEAQEQIREAALTIAEDMSQIRKSVKTTTKALRAELKETQDKVLRMAEAVERIEDRVSEIESQSRTTRLIQLGIYGLMLIAGAMLLLMLLLWQAPVLELVVKAFNALHM